MSKTYVLHPTAIVGGYLKSSSSLSDNWNNLYERDSYLRAGAGGDWVESAYFPGSYIWNTMRCTNFMFDSATLSTLRTKGIQSITFKTKLSGYLFGSDRAVHQHQIRYKYDSDSGAGSTEWGQHWASASSADSTSQGNLSVGTIGTSSSSDETVTDQEMTVSLSGAVPKYGYVIGPSAFNNRIVGYGNNRFLQFSSTLSDTTLTVVTDEVENYSVIYSGNADDPSEVSGVPPVQTYYVGASVTLSNAVPSRTGYRFLGWSQSSAASTASYVPGGTYTFSANVTMYAVWEKKTYTITFNANGGTGAPASQTKTYGTDLTLSATTPTRDGYSFLGWATSNVATTIEYAAGGTFTENENASLYAVWQVVVTNHTLTYSANGGSNAPSPQTVAYSVENEATFTVTSAQPTRSNYRFSGWSTTSGGEVQYFASDTIPASADRTLYAVWEQIVFTISYNANGGSNAPASQSKQKGVALTLTLSSPTKTGAVFKGWATSDSAATADYHGGDSFTTDADTMLYAVWSTFQAASLFVVQNGTPVACGAYVVQNGVAIPCTLYVGG